MPYSNEIFELVNKSSKDALRNILLLFGVKFWLEPHEFMIKFCVGTQDDLYKLRRFKRILDDYGIIRFNEGSRMGRVMERNSAKWEQRLKDEKMTLQGEKP